MKFVVRVAGRESPVDIVKRDGLYEIQLNGKKFSVDSRNFGDTELFSLLVDGKSYLVDSAPVRAERGEYYARVLGRHYDVDVLDELQLAARDAEKTKEHTGAFILRAPMPGLIVHMHAAAGAKVKAGEPIVIMEAMKMRNELTSDVTGVVKAVAVKVGDKVDSQATLVTIERE
ncbi:MAG TPA: biotin/lipoyl-containing protein [Candidatus Krumholzibacteria bacterium]|nr:biotin/lipoyl-containing protein [Candidatus Krumholzibacteria bacterium]